MNTNKIIKNLEILQTNMPDLIIRKIKSGLFSYIHVVTFQTLSSEDKVNNFILKYFSNKKNISHNFNSKENIKSFIPTINEKEIKNEEDAQTYLFNGFTLVFVKNKIYSFETKALLDRAITEPTSEPTIKGPKDSFNENINMNLGLIRRRLKNNKLFVKECVIGRKTLTKIDVLYIDDIIDKKLVDEVMTKLNNIKTDSILDSHYIKELIKKENKTLFPVIRASEKPDEACKHLLLGKIILIVENSPNILIIPTFFIDLFRTSEDYHQNSFYTSFVRIMRLFAFFLSIALPAIYLAIIIFDQQILPTSLLVNFMKQREGVPFPAFIEALILITTFEILYEGDSRTPTSRGTSLSILGALVLGDAAVTAGLVSPIMVIVISLCAISSLLFVYIDLQGVIRFYRYLLLFLATSFGIIGLCIGLTILLIDLSHIKTFGKPYLLPLIPFNKKRSKDAIIRTPMTNGENNL